MMIPLNFQLTALTHEGTIRFDEPFRITRPYGSGDDEEYEIVGASYTFQSPNFPPDAGEEAHYYNVNPTGYGPMNKDGSRPKRQRHPVGVWMDYDDQKILARKIAEHLECGSSGIDFRLFIWPDTVT